MNFNPFSSGLTHSSLPIKDVLDIGDGSGDTQIDSKVDQDSRYGGVQFPDGSIMRFANIDNNVDDVIADVPPIRQIHGEQFPAKYISQN